MRQQIPEVSVIFDHTKPSYFKYTYSESAESKNRLSTECIRLVEQHNIFDQVKSEVDTVCEAAGAFYFEHAKLFIDISPLSKKEKMVSPYSLILNLWGLNSGQLRELITPIKSYLEAPKVFKRDKIKEKKKSRFRTKTHSKDILPVPEVSRGNKKTLFEDHRVAIIVLTAVALYRVQAMKMRGEGYQSLLLRICDYIHDILNARDQDGLIFFEAHEQGGSLSNDEITFRGKLLDLARVAQSEIRVLRGKSARMILLSSDIHCNASESMKSFFGDTHEIHHRIQENNLSSLIVEFRAHLVTKCIKTNSTGLRQIMSIRHKEKYNFSDALQIIQIIQARVDRPWSLKRMPLLFKPGRHPAVDQIYRILASFSHIDMPKGPREKEVVYQGIIAVFQRTNDLLKAKNACFTYAATSQAEAPFFTSALQ